jgi:hypothetical protein
MTITYKKEQLKRDMLQTLAALEETLLQHFAIRAMAAETEAQTREKANQKMQEIVGLSQSVLARFNAAIEWSERVNNKQADEFDAVKIEFGRHQRKRFKPYLALDQARCNAVISCLRAEAIVLEENFKKEKDTVNQQADQEIAQFSVLRKTAENLTAVSIDLHSSDAIYQRGMTQLKNAVAQQRISPVIKTAAEPARKETPELPLLTVCLQAMTLAELDKNIQQYQAHLAVEPFFKKVARFFSPTRGKRNAAIAEYKKIQAISDIARRYSAAENWFKNYGMTEEFSDDSTSRFYRTCIAPFNASHAQNYFSQLPVLQSDNNLRVKRDEERIKTTVRAHNDQIAYLHKQHKVRATEYNALHQQVSHLSKAIDSVENTLAYGFVRTGSVEKAQKAVCVTLNNLSPAGAVAHQIIRDVLSLPNKALKENINALRLADRAKAIQHDPEAVALIFNAMEDLIKDTRRYGGVGANACWMGTLAANQVMKELGTADQQKRFANEFARAFAQGEAQEKIVNAEKAIHLLVKLEPKLQDGTLQTALVRLRDAYDKHHKLDGKISDKISEKIYKTDVKPFLIQAEQIHQSGDKQLADFVQAAITSAYKLSFERTPKADDPYAQLSLDSITTLALIFGTKAQLKHWEGKLLPEIQHNNGRRDENDLVSPSLLANPKLKL